MSAEAAAADWRPTADRAALVRRAELAAAVRTFFAARGVLEVETPLLGATTTPEPHLESLVVTDGGRTWYLQTSPEHHMKRLLAAGSGPIFQLSRVVRGGEAGRRHNREFTILEWYRPGFDHHRLIDEVEELLTTLLGPTAQPLRRLTYGEAFERHAGVDPHRCPVADLDRAIDRAGIRPPPFSPGDRDGRLHLLMAMVVEPALAPGRVAIHDFPASQASLARVRPSTADGPALAERFEIFVDGVELANGFHELADAAEQRSRFEADLAHRRAAGLAAVPLDERLLAALGHGLPDSAGVALGFDRLVMLASGAPSIDAVIAFPVDRA